MKNGESEEGKTWEEELYWKHFNAVHFYQVLPNDFLHHLVLPSKFAENMSCKMPKKVSLVGPSGSSWDVEVSTTNNVAIVGEGWKDFVKTYKLEENYMLVFKYTRYLSFEVLIFDQKNLCEKEGSYFVKKGLSKPNDKVGRKRSVEEAASREMMDGNDDDGGSDCVLSKKSKRCSGGVADNGKRNVVLEAPRVTPSDDWDDGVDVVVVSSGGTPICQNEAEVTGCVTSEKLKKCSADQGKKSVGEASVTALVEFKSSDKTRTKAVEVASSGGTPISQNEAEVTGCVTSEKLKKCSADQGKKSVGEAPVTALVEFKSSDKTRTKAVEVASLGGTPICQNEAEFTGCVTSEKLKKCYADQGKKSVGEAPVTALVEFKSSDKTRTKAVEVASSGGTPICQNEAEVTGCVTSEKLKKCSADQGKKSVGEAPVTVSVELKSSDKTKTKAVEVASSGVRTNEADVADDAPISVLISGLVASNSKRLSAKPSDNTTVNCTLNQQQQIPIGDGEKVMNEVAVLSPVNNGYTLSNTLSAEAKNGKGTPGTIRSREVGAKKSLSVRAIPRSGKKLALKSDTQRVSKEYTSHRRPVTDEEKEAALKRATEALTEGGFHVVMRPTSVYKRFYLCIPAEWVDKHLSCNHKKVVLRAGEKIWVVMFHNSSDGHSAGFATGWKSFALENNLEDSDVCVFKPATQNDNARIFDVKIFRVVPEITPLTPVVCSI